MIETDDDEVLLAAGAARGLGGSHDEELGERSTLLLPFPRHRFGTRAFAVSTAAQSLDADDDALIETDTDDMLVDGMLHETRGRLPPRGDVPEAAEEAHDGGAADDHRDGAIRGLCVLSIPIRST